jgi:zinc transporter ZupT
MLPRLGQFLHAAEEVAAREILLGVTEVFPRHAEVLSGFTEVIVAVAAMVVMTVVAVVAMMTVMVVMAVVMVVVMIEQIVQETSDERSRKWQQTEHCYSPLSLGVPAPASCRRSGCLLTV